MLDCGMARKKISAKRWYVRGRVQGVGYRWFAQNSASLLNLSGYARNLDDGRVEIYAIGPEDKLNEMAAMLYRGPRWADVRGVEEQEAELLQRAGFTID
jgi:acylphosphatase